MTAHDTTPTAAALTRPETTACTACGTTRGYWHPTAHMYTRPRGLCHICYSRAYYYGTLPATWEACPRGGWSELSPALAGTALTHPNVNPRPWQLSAIPEDADQPQLTRYVRHAPWAGEGLAFLAETDDLTLTEAA